MQSIHFSQAVQFELLLTFILLNFYTALTKSIKLHFFDMTAPVLRSHFNKLRPKIIHYRDYKNFLNDVFRSELVIENGNLQNFNDLEM